MTRLSKPCRRVALVPTAFPLPWRCAAPFPSKTPSFRGLYFATPTGVLNVRTAAALGFWAACLGHATTIRRPFRASPLCVLQMRVMQPRFKTRDNMHFLDRSGSVIFDVAGPLGAAGED
jgi:hypothetical protein